MPNPALQRVPAATAALAAGAPLPRIAALALATALLSACGDTTLLDPMERQPKYRPFAANPFFDDGRAMRKPPEGTVPRERNAGNFALTLGKDKDGADVAAIPLTLTRERLQQGRKRFEIVCAACHGLVGDGDSPVASQMSLKRPPSLLALTATPGRIYQIVTFGWGLMPGYAAQLSVEERWAVVGYVQALARSQNARLVEAPPAERAKLEAAK